MYTATDKPPLALFRACQVYRDFWAKLWISEDPACACDFRGSSKDLDALGYCEFECGFPDSDFSLAGLIWAQVVINNSPFQWAETEDKTPAICSGNRWPRFLFYPVIRMREIMAGSYSQFDSIELLNEAFLIQAMAAGHSERELRDLISILVDRSRRESTYPPFQRVSEISIVLNHSSSRGRKPTKE